MRKFLIFTTLSLVLLGCDTETTSKKKIVIAVASSMAQSMNRLEVEFEKNHDIDLQIISGSSGKICTQILEGAEYDLFISADESYPLQIYTKGLSTSAPIPYTKGKLVVWSCSDTSFEDLNVLKSHPDSKIAIPNPKLAPYGKAAIEALKKSNLFDTLSKQIVYADNVSQTAQYIINENVLYGLTAKSMVMTPENLGKGRWIEVNPDMYAPIIHTLVILKSTEHLSDCEIFVKHIQGQEGRTILKQFGFE